MDVILGNLPAYWAGFLVTARLTVVAGLASLVVGTALAALRVAPLRPLRVFSTAWVELLRNTPLTLVFFFTILVLPQFGVVIGSFDGAAVTCLTAYTSAFVCEAVRSGINSIGTGQAEAARAIGLTFGQGLRHVILPQAVRSVIPPLINVIIALAKNTSVAAGFGVVELVATGRRVALANPGSALIVLLGVGAFYLAFTVPAGILAGAVERRVAFTR